MEQEVVICEACGRRTPAKSKVCSVCGVPLKNQTKGKKHLIFPIIAGSLILACIIAYAVLSQVLTADQLDKFDMLLLCGVLATPYVSLFFASVPPRRERIECTGEWIESTIRQEVKFPDVCVLTGEPATQTHVLTHFKFNFYSIQRIRVSLPFSIEGRELYLKTTPVSLRIYKGGLNVCMQHIWLLGGPFAAYIWSPMMGLLCGLGALIELFFGKRQQVVPTGIIIKGASIVTFSVKGVHKKFAEAFYEMNKAGEA